MSSMRAPVRLIEPLIDGESMGRRLFAFRAASRVRAGAIGAEPAAGAAAPGVGAPAVTFPGAAGALPPGGTAPWPCLAACSAAIRCRRSVSCLIFGDEQKVLLITWILRKHGQVLNWEVAALTLLPCLPNLSGLEKCHRVTGQSLPAVLGESCAYLLACAGVLALLVCAAG